MTSSNAGRALITDFDGTLTQLDVDWETLRRELGVSRIGELWSRGVDAFVAVTRAELAAAGRARDHARAVEFASEFSSFAVLSDNSEGAVALFLERHDVLKQRCALVVGRETLAGSKRDASVFGRGIAACAAALSRAPRDCVYLGDDPGELAHARALELHVIDVATLFG